MTTLHEELDHLRAIKKELRAALDQRQALARDRIAAALNAAMRDYHAVITQVTVGIVHHYGRDLKVDAVVLSDVTITFAE